MLALDNKHLASDLPTRSETQNFSLKYKMTKCEQRINSFFVKEEHFTV